MRKKDDEKEYRIRQAVIELMLKEGFYGTSIAKIAKAANVSPATVYIYYENKEEMLQDIYQKCSESVFYYLTQGINCEMNRAGMIETLIRRYYAYMTQHPEAFCFIEQFANCPALYKNCGCGRGIHDIIRWINDNSAQDLSQRYSEESISALLFYPIKAIAIDHSRSKQEKEKQLDELIEMMKPWYDNYCFAEECYGGATMYNSNMVLYFVRNYLDNNGKAPRTYPGRFLHDDEKPDCAVWTQPGKRDTDLFGSFVFLVELCEEGQQQNLVFVVACKQLQAVALLLDQTAHRDVAGERRFQIKNVSLRALQIHTALAGFDCVQKLLDIRFKAQSHRKHILSSWTPRPKAPALW